MNQPFVLYIRKVVVVIKIIQVVGFKNSGKTTVTSRLTRLFIKEGYRVGTIKNHGGGGNIKKVSGTDTERHLQAGSSMSTVVTDKEWLMSFKDVEDKNLDDLIKYYELSSIDLIIIEGMKHLDYPKIVLLKDDNESESLLQLTNIKAIGGWSDVKQLFSKKLNVPYFLNEKIEEKKHEIFKSLQIER